MVSPHRLEKLERVMIMAYNRLVKTQSPTAMARHYRLVSAYFDKQQMQSYRRPTINDQRECVRIF